MCGMCVCAFKCICVHVKMMQKYGNWDSDSNIRYHDAHSLSMGDSYQALEGQRFCYG